MTRDAAMRALTELLDAGEGYEEVVLTATRVWPKEKPAAPVVDPAAPTALAAPAPISTVPEYDFAIRPTRPLGTVMGHQAIEIANREGIGIEASDVSLR